MIHEQYTHTVKLQTHTHTKSTTNKHTHTVKLQANGISNQNVSKFEERLSFSTCKHISEKKIPTANLTILGVECKIVLFASLFNRT